MAGKKATSPFEALVAELKQLADRLVNDDGLGDAQAKKRAMRALDQVARQLTTVASGLDPVLRPASLFDPADPATAGRIIALTLVAQPRHSLAQLPLFYGSGVYAIYYTGGLEAYRQLSGVEHPLYVGTADPADQTAKDAISQGTALASRIKYHAGTIRRATSTLSVDDFSCRFLIVQTGFQKSAEDYLINFFRPIWNKETKVCYGIGKHGDSATTRANKRSPWDTMHPGRNWAEGTTEDQKQRGEIAHQIEAHLRNYPPYKDIHQIFDRFLSDMRQLHADPIHE